ncbi:hypothetical protein Q1W73_11260 [Asticcacaulis sp. ZE23SCel15]|uniref:hypothetical protein n=1 Tax=Asticcacaulis sp. ZE23SCel15 TaxID=3059027 RepID=UPI00265E12A3|nr:hypothetical protein [Asticcacaulis sp. ZE23SCel15]WKL56268.1 hypothetical protein Q1W73_11260 [Asticcacaulis sp. ZE23SCel15]
MKFLNILRAGFVLGASLFSAHAYADSQWVKAESENFVIYSNVKPEYAQAYAVNLEKYRYVIGAFYRRVGQDALPEPKLNIYFVKNPSDLEQVWPGVSSSVLGFVRFCANGMAGYSLYDGDRIRTTGNIKRQEENQSQTVIFHEYAHLFMFQNSQIAYPSWFVEGFAEFYGTTRVQDDQAVVGMAWSGRVHPLMSGGSLKYEDILRGAPHIRRPANQGLFYAQSWLMTHWILSDPKRTQALSAYVVARNRGDDPVKAFETAFGVPVSKLSTVLGSYMRTLKATIYTVKDMPVPQITLTSLPASADKLLLWDSSVKSCLPKDLEPGTLAKIRTEAAKFPNDDYAKGALARAEIIYGDEEKALDYYRAYTTANPKDPEGFFRLGQTLFLMARHDKFAAGETFDTQMKKARTAFGKAYTLDPLNAVNLYYLSMTARIGPNGPDNSSLNAAYEAHLLAPSIPEYAMNAARMLISKDRMADARRAMASLANNPHGGAFAQWVGTIIAGIDAGKTKTEVLALMATPVPEDKPDEDTGKDKAK